MSSIPICHVSAVQDDISSKTVPIWLHHTTVQVSAATAVVPAGPGGMAVPDVPPEPAPGAPKVAQIMRKITYFIRPDFAKKYLLWHQWIILGRDKLTSIY